MSLEFALKIECGNDAFGESQAEACDEIARILEKLALELRTMRSAPTQRAAMRKVLVAPLATMTDDMAARLRQDNRLTGKRIGGHLCVVATPKN